MFYNILLWLVRWGGIRTAENGGFVAGGGISEDAGYRLLNF